MGSVGTLYMAPGLYAGVPCERPRILRVSRDVGGHSEPGLVYSFHRNTKAKACRKSIVGEHHGTLRHKQDWIADNRTR